MKFGLLWYDADRRLSPQARLARAVLRFADKFGRPANCCHVNPEQLFEDASIIVRPDPSVLKHHFWVGRDEALEPKRTRRRRAAAAEVTPSQPAPVAAVSAPVRPRPFSSRIPSLQSRPPSLRRREPCARLPAVVASGSARRVAGRRHRRPPPRGQPLR